MNRIRNDKGEYVIAEGAPYSTMRMKCQYPALLEQLTELKQSQGKLSLFAIDEALCNAGVPLHLQDTFYEIANVI